MQFPIIIGLHRSRILDRFLLLVTATAIGACWVWPLALFVRLAAVAVILAGLPLIWRKLEPEPCFVKLDHAGQVWASADPRDGFVAMRVLPGGIVHPWLTVIRLQDEHQGRHVVVATVDMMRADDFRRLRMFLRWRAKFNEPESGA